MQYTAEYRSNIGKIILASDGECLTGLWFDGQKHSESYLQEGNEARHMPIFDDANRWLDIYFSGKEPNFALPVRMHGSAFQMQVWERLCAIPYGKTVTYGELAEEVARLRGVPKMSAQAVGGAIGRNKISIVVPCHRVVGANGSLVGYAGGISRKAALLELEGSYFDGDRI